jgi:hypothetical protein
MTNWLSPWWPRRKPHGVVTDDGSGGTGDATGVITDDGSGGTTDTRAVTKDDLMVACTNMGSMS